MSAGSVSPIPATAPAQAAPSPGPVRQPRVVLVAAVLAGLLILGAWQAAGWRQGTAAGLGLLLGLALYHASFGFTSAWRKLATTGEGAGLRAQMLMLAVAVTVAYPLLTLGSAFGQPLWGFVFPVGVSVAVGAFLFGIGMQLGGGCASGTLYTVGGGNTKMVLTLAAFIAGSVIGTLHLDWWLALPNIGGVLLPGTLGLLPALVLTLAVFGGIWVMTAVVERRRHGRVASIGGAGSLLSGPWPLLWGALALAVLNLATLLVLGRPWGVTSAFALWGAQAAHGVGLPIAEHAAWAGRIDALEMSLLLDGTSVMNFGILLGALAAAALAGKFAPGWRIAPGAAAAAILGGLLMGYGARLAFGCNIGAYFSGLMSGSLHGWLWLATGWLGSLIGIRLRRVFGL